MKTICAVIVTCNPDRVLIDTVNSVLSQVDHIVIVDNSENPWDEDVTIALPLKNTLSKIENGFNWGIAKALNQGINAALKQGYTYALLMDHDSTMLPGSVGKLIDAVENNDNVFIACPTSKTGNLPDKHRKKGPLVDKLTCITSGSLLNLKLTDTIGLHNEKLFIDLVDHELCLRAKDMGYRIVQVNNALMSHRLGKLGIRKFYPFTFYPTHHPPIRRYYKARNSLYVWKKYFFRYPGYVLPGMARFLRMVFEILLLERDKRKNFRMIFEGIRDFCLGRYGKYYI